MPQNYNNFSYFPKKFETFLKYLEKILIDTKLQGFKCYL
jgi:hypothetical protein